MSATANHPNSGATSQQPEPSCRILILHEDFSSYSRVLDVCQRVMARFAGELEFDVKYWNAVELSESHSARHAARAAAVADIVVVSLKTCRMPGELSRWLEEHFVARFKSLGLLVLIMDEEPDSLQGLNRTMLLLNRLAVQLRMDFLALYSGDETVVAKVAMPLAREHPALVLSAEVAGRPEPDHWGLNE